VNASRALLGIYLPGNTVWHRLGVGWKYVVFLVLSIPAVLASNPWMALAALGASLALVATTRAPLRLAWGLPMGLVVLLGCLGGYHVLTGHWEVGVTIVATVLAALYACRILLITTPGPVLIDALVAAARPFRRIGVDPERFGLAVSIMVRSVPFVAGAFTDVRDAARARGLRRNPLALITPVVIQTVAYARTTGDALTARGLGESSRDKPDDTSDLVS
jgi:biotin transport system permease protein